MKSVTARRLMPLIASLLCALVVASCGTSAPAPAAAPPAPTQPAAAPAAAAPTKAAPAAAPAQPTAAPAKKVDYPTPGKAITLMVPFPAGGSNDIGARLVAPVVEKDLGVPVQIVNKAGAGGQTGWAELALAKPDGYYIGSVNLPTVSVMAMDPERKATFSRNSFVPISAQSVSPTIVVVKADSPYKALKELIEDAKAHPMKVKASAAGVLATRHLSVLQTQQATGAQFSVVQFDGGAPQLTALLGGHVDVGFHAETEPMSQLKSGAVRALGIMDTQRSKSYPDVPTFKEQGYDITSMVTVFNAVPAGTPKEIVETLDRAFKKATTDADVKAKAEAAGTTLRYMSADELSAYWDQVEKEVKPLLELAKKQ